MSRRTTPTGPRPEYKVLDLFAGCGGLTQGFKEADVGKPAAGSFVPRLAVEHDLDAAATYAANHGPHVFAGPIEDWLDDVDLDDIDVVIGGPPCQGFSWLGRRDPKDPRNKLWDRYVDAVAAVQPYYFVIENVIPFLRSDQYQDLRKEMSPGGRLANYVPDHACQVHAKDFGSPQDRRRAVVIGRRNDVNADDVDLSKWERPERTVRDAFGRAGLDHHVSETEFPDRTKKVEMLPGRFVEVPGTFTRPELHVTRYYSPLSVRRIKAIPAGGSRKNLPPELLSECWKNHTTGHADTMGRMHWDRPSVTIRTEFWKPEKGRYLHPSADRAITHAEASVLQGFPATYQWCGTKTSIGRQIGNAVPVHLGRAVGRAILEALTSSETEPKR
jgi:DNA (cytosine-5)-methyltransferase 1